MVGVDNRWPEQMAPVMDGGEGGFGWLTGWDFYEGNKSKFLTQGALSLSYRISYKILLLAYKALNGLAPAYLTSLLSRYNPSRSLRSQNSGLLVVPRIAKSTKGGRAFSYLAPKLWNSLPGNVWGSDTLSLFKSRLKTHLFSQAFT